MEIERKFLLSKLPDDIKSLPATFIEQGYLNTDKERTTRIRVTSANEAFLTVKGATHGITRVEVETPIDPVKARDMLALCEASIVSKWRRIVEHEGHIWEVDVFTGDNEGLVIAEIEFSSEAETFALPSWVGAEVSHDRRYGNSALASKPFKTWVQPVLDVLKPTRLNTLGL